MSIGVVVIGRNEGERLRRCLESITGITDRVVYVDSGSTDGSLNVARSIGSEVVSLDMKTPFTAARARNDGCKLLLKLVPSLDYVQFVDGDCELVNGWLETAAAFLDSHNNVAMVCGRLRERYPDHSIYNQLCDTEWDTPVGLTKACGGIAMVKVATFEATGGFRDDLIAGEEPELCVRLRARGCQVWRLDTEMALHDAAMTHFRQWWNRTLRTGYAYAEGAHLHGAPPERHWVKESRRALIWGLGVPVVTVSMVVLLGAWGLVMLLIYPAQIARLALKDTRPVKRSWLRALFLVLGKFPEAMGNLNFIYNRLTGKAAHLIEYK